MKFLSSILIFSISLSALADCRIPQGNTFVVLGEGQSISLLDAGKPLANQKVQDQDGLGTCYANAASVMLKTVLPGKPDVSYLHAAVESATQGVRGIYNKDDGKYWRVDDAKKEKSFADGGFICETVEALKKTGGACRVDQSLFEKDNILSTLQEDVFKNLGKYFDALNKVKSKPAEYEKFRSDLILAVESINSARQDIKDQCYEQKKSDVPLQGALIKYLGNQYFNMSGEDFCSQLRLEELKKITTSDSLFRKDRVRVKPNSQFMAKLRTEILTDPILKANLPNYLAGKKIPRLDEIKMESQMGKIVNRVFNGHVKPKSSFPVCDGVKDVYTDTPDQIGYAFLRSMKESKTSTCPVDNDILLNEAFSKNACKDPANLDLVLSAIDPLLEVGRSVDQNLVNQLLNTDPSNANQLKKIIMPGCSLSENRIPMDNINCASYTPCETNHLKKIDNTFFSAEKSKCEDLNSAMTQTRKMIHEGITQGRSLGVSVCTSFMIDPTFKTEFCKIKRPSVDKHAYHAMAVTGLRCSNGKVEYQLLNSWGKYHCPRGAQVTNSPLKCDKNNHGTPTGRFWVPEDVMVDSMTALSEIK